MSGEGSDYTEIQIFNIPSEEGANLNLDGCGPGDGDQKL